MPKARKKDHEDKADTWFILFRTKIQRTFRLNTYGRNKESAEKFFNDTLKLTEECYLYKMEGLTAKIKRID